MARIAIDHVDGIRLRSFIFAGSKWLSYHRFYLDKINYFPVPDGDTGANMYLTLTAVCAALRNVKNPRSAGDAAKEAAMGALMGSKGNSGIILAQYFRGFSESIGGKKIINGHDISKALEQASKTARAGVINPREGTILSVARDGAAACRKNGAIIDVLNDFYRASLASLERTKNMLAELKKAGVVDAGGKGLVLFFEGMLRLATGKSVKESPEINMKTGSGRKKTEPVKHRYCTSFILRKKQGITDLAVRIALKKCGDSVVIDKGIKNISKLHAHTNLPDALLEKASELGVVENVNIEDIAEQVKRRNK